jgi:hypothetical protein
MPTTAGVPSGGSYVIRSSASDGCASAATSSSQVVFRRSNHRAISRHMPQFSDKYSREPAAPAGCHGRRRGTQRLTPRL